MTDQAPSPTNPYRGNKAITVLRIFLWLLPAGILVCGLLMAGGLSNVMPQALGIAVAIIFTVAAVAGVGYFDYRLSLQQKRIPPPHEISESLRWTAIFFLSQILIAPTVAFAAAFGICMVMMSGGF